MLKYLAIVILIWAVTQTPSPVPEKALDSASDESLNTYSAQQESFAGSFRREMATILSASAIVG